MKKLIQELKQLYDEESPRIFEFVEKQLAQKTTEPELLFSMARTIIAPPNVDERLSIACLEKILIHDKNNVNALLLITYVYRHYLGGIDEQLLNKILSLHTQNPESNSMLKYVASWSYDNDPYKQEKLLKTSISEYSEHVWNYVDLARFYLNQGKNIEAKELIKKALSNVKKIYNNTEITKYDPTDIDEFLNERIKGIYLTDVNFKTITEMLAANV